MTSINLNVNGEAVAVDVTPRTHLADMLREQLRHTGTHLGCEQGVCGACMVLLDGVPVRSCLIPAVTCDGQEVRSIEGLEDDAITNELREAFKIDHGVQCGFCTPGMLISARDIVMRVPDADEPRIRYELSGNLCRCTGYIGIVNAVHRVLKNRRAAGLTSSAPVAEVVIARAAAGSTIAAASLPKTQSQAASAPVALRPDESGAPRSGWTRFSESFVIADEPAGAWRVLADFPLVASCLPGAELTEHGDRHVKGRMLVKLGPIRAAFAGSASVELDNATRTGRIRGAGSDSGSGSRTKAEANYQVLPDPAGSRVSLTVDYNLQGSLAQFSRSGLAQDLGRRLISEFAANLNARIARPQEQATVAAPLDAGKMLSASMLQRVRDFVKRWTGIGAG